METFNFEEAMNRLNVIAQQLEDENLPLETAIKLFEEGLDLSKKCQIQLDSYEQTVKDLVNKHRGDNNA